MNMKVAIGSDDIGFDLKNSLIDILKEKNVEFEDLGVRNKNEVDRYYPDIAFEVTRHVQSGKFDRGILVCGTGIGMAIVANKLRGIRAACCHDIYSVQRSILSNDCQIITMGSLVIGKCRAQELLRFWLDIKRNGGTVRKVKRIEALEGKL
jgi:ribose 5-phosphate isomerase B